MKTLQTIIILILVLLVSYLLIFYKGKPVSYPEPHYVFDTVFLDKPYPVPLPYPVEVPIQGITVYLKDSVALDSMNILIQEKDFIIQGLEREILISKNFLKQFPSNPKILELNLSSDTLNLSLLNLDGTPSSSNYGLRLSDHKYKWTNDGLSQIKINPHQVKKSINLNYFAGGGVNFLYLSPFASFGLETDIARIRLYSDIEVGLLKHEASSINLGVKYRINK